MSKEQPTCRHLRTKKMYVPALQGSGGSWDDNGTARYWCLKTMAAVGPDDDFVDLHECRPHRRCFESLE
jgi:hypothetical protein